MEKKKSSALFASRDMGGIFRHTEDELNPIGILLPDDGENVVIDGIKQLFRELRQKRVVMSFSSDPVTAVSFFLLTGHT